MQNVLTRRVFMFRYIRVDRITLASQRSARRCGDDIAEGKTGRSFLLDSPLRSFECRRFQFAAGILSAASFRVRSRRPAVFGADFVHDGVRGQSVGAVTRTDTHCDKRREGSILSAGLSCPGLNACFFQEILPRVLPGDNLSQGGFE